MNREVNSASVSSIKNTPGNSKLQGTTRNYTSLHSKREYGVLKDKDYQREQLEKIGEELGVKQLDDWHKIQPRQVTAKNGYFLRTYYNSSLFAALKTLYPHHEWDPHKFATVPQSYWKDENNQRKQLERIGKELGVTQLDDWYKIQTRQVKAKNGSFLTMYYNGSLYSALKALYPDQQWDPVKFSTQNYWKDKNNQRNQLEKIGKELGVKQLDDWYKIQPRQVTAKNGAFLSSYYNSSLFAALKTLYPHHEWDPHKFATVPRNYWKDEINQRKQLERIGKELGINQSEDWYKIQSSQVKTKKGSFLVHYYNSNLFTALKALYPDHKWSPHKFAAVPHGFWKDDSTKKEYYQLFLNLIHTHQIKNLCDWYNMPPDDITLFQRAAKGIFGSVSAMLTNWFPETNWHSQLQSSNPEQELQWMIKLATKDVKIHHNIEGHSLDIYVPDWRLAIEYQGEQHYQQTWRGDFKSQQIRDDNKQQYLQQNNISLVTVNHQWNGSWQQLKATIRQARPDLLEPDFNANLKQHRVTFPCNITIEQIKSAIKPYQNFFHITENEFCITVDYNKAKLIPVMEYKNIFQNPETAPDNSNKLARQIIRECRGLKFSRKGEVLCRPFHKFFNLNELPEVKESSIRLQKIACVLEKYDGKMIAPVKAADSGIRFLTRGGHVDTALETYLTGTNHAAFAGSIISKNKTPIYEFISNNYQTVVRYKEPSLILLSIRDNLTGEYSSYQELKEEANNFAGITVAKEWPAPMNLDSFTAMKTGRPGMEGYVVTMKNGLMFKVKSAWWREQRDLLKNAHF